MNDSRINQYQEINMIYLINIFKKSTLTFPLKIERPTDKRKPRAIKKKISEGV